VAPLLNEAEIEAQAHLLSGWEVQGETLQSIRKFRNFVEAIAFVNKLVEPAESADHHPDLQISYNKVTVVLTTHDSGGLTQKDFDLAQQISQI
jgi:4a-hydroxytetrahydrobiopterin dehydratase